MSYFVVDDAYLKQLKLLLSMKNEAAQALGVNILDVLTQEKRLVAEIGSKDPTQDQLLRLGALRHEGKKFEQFFLSKIEAFNRDQARVGDEALRATGLNADRDELTIDISNGLVLRLESGAWKPVKRETYEA